MTDYQMAINGNCDPHNNALSQSSPKNIENIFGTAINSGMCVDRNAYHKLVDTLVLYLKRPLSFTKGYLSIGKTFLPHLKHIN